MDIHLVCNDDDPLQQIEDGDDIKCHMEVVKITTRGKTSHQDVQIYNIRLASCGWSDNIRDRVITSFNKTSYSDMVQQIFNNEFLSGKVNGLSDGFLDKDKKNIVVEDTIGEYSVVIPGWKPIVCFNWLAGRSQSKANKDAVNYFFWEDKDQYNFKSIDSIFSNQSEVDTYYVKLQNVDKDDKRNYYNISDYTYEDTGDILLYALNGTFGTRLITHDITRKQINDHTMEGYWSLDYNVTQDPIDYTDNFDKLSHADKNGKALIDEDVSYQLSTDPGDCRIMVQPKCSFGYDGIGDFKYEDWLRQRVMQKPLMKYLRLTIYAVGMFKRKAGDIISIDLPSPEESKGLEDKRLTGNYLVANVRRVFTPDKHVMVLECVKDCIHA